MPVIHLYMHTTIHIFTKIFVLMSMIELMLSLLRKENLLDFCQLRSASGATIVVIVGGNTFLIYVCLYFCRSF